jgi:hypothetical protein
VDGRDIDVGLGAGGGTATFRGRNMHMPDFHDFENAILGNGAQPSPAVVSFTVRWTASGDVVSFDNVPQHYRGEMWTAVNPEATVTAQMEWSALSGNYEYRSTPLADSRSDFAQIGTESNGSFF